MSVLAGSAVELTRIDPSGTLKTDDVRRLLFVSSLVIDQSAAVTTRLHRAVSSPVIFKRFSILRADKTCFSLRPVCPWTQVNSSHFLIVVVQPAIFCGVSNLAKGYRALAKLRRRDLASACSRRHRHR